MTFASTQAQTIVPGFKGGLNVANLSNTGDDNRISGHLGFFVHMKIAKDLTFFAFLYVNEKITNASDASTIPVKHTPFQPLRAQTYSPIKDPSEVPIKLTVMYTVLSRLRAPGINAYTRL